MSPDLLFYLAPFGAVAALLFAVFFYKNLMKESEGDKKMKAIANKYGLNFLIPDVNQGTSVESLIKDIEELAASGASLDMQVFFFDTHTGI